MAFASIGFFFLNKVYPKKYKIFTAQNLMEVCVFLPILILPFSAMIIGMLTNLAVFLLKNIMSLYDVGSNHDFPQILLKELP